MAKQKGIAQMLLDFPEFVGLKIFSHDFHVSNWKEKRKEKRKNLQIIQESKERSTNSPWLDTCQGEKLL